MAQDDGMPGGIGEAKRAGRPRMTLEQKQAAKAAKIAAAKPAAVIREPLQEQKPVPQKYKMKAKPNWEEIDPTQVDTPDRLRIPPDMIPDGMSLQWVTSSVLGQSMAQHRSTFERTGWTPVHQEDFDYRFNGMFMPRNADGEITVEGLVLMARPIELTEKARQRDRRQAREQLEIKERAFKSGEIPNVTLDAGHESALRTNKISRTYERIEVPKD